MENLATALIGLMGGILGGIITHWLKSRSDENERRLGVFRDLMATRGSTMSLKHVDALNAIPIEFYRHKGVKDAWEALYTHLHRKDWEPNQWLVKKTDLLVALLSVMGKHLKYQLNDREIQSIYYPDGHDKLEKAQQAVLFGWADILVGGKSLRMEVTNLPNQENE